MKNIIKYILVISLIALWSFSNAHEKITRGSKVKVKPGTHFIEKGNIKITDTAQFIVEGMLTVDHKLRNENVFSGIQLKSNAENTGSIIYDNGKPTAKIERYMRSGRGHYIGSPVMGESAAALDFTYPNTRLVEYIDGYGYNQINDTSTELINAKGYSYRINPSNEGGITAVFEGKLTADDLELDHNSLPAIQFNSKGVNILANPYACAIDWDDPSIEFSDLEATIWVFDANEGRMKYRNHAGYGTLTDGIIPMGQGFLVRAHSTEATLTIPKQARRHHQQQFYKSTDEVYEDLNYMILELQKDDLIDEIWVGYQWNSTDEFDNGIDISKLFSYEESHQIFTSHNEENFTIDLVEDPGFESKQVPVYVRVASNGVHQLNLAQFQGFSGVDVQLEDLVTGNFMDVKTMDVYQFTANIEDNELRFIIHFNPKSATGNDEYTATNNQVKIYGYRDQIYIKSEGDYVLQNKKVFLYDLNGKQLAEIPLNEGHITSIKNKFKRKMIIVKAKYQTDTFTEKIIYIK